jgi:hypothetical protein
LQPEKTGFFCPFFCPISWENSKDFPLASKLPKIAKKPKKTRPEDTKFDQPRPDLGKPVIIGFFRSSTGFGPNRSVTGHGLVFFIFSGNKLSTGMNEYG